MKICNLGNYKEVHTKKMQEISEQFFGTAHDPEQIPIGNQALERCKQISINSLTYMTDDLDEPVAWVMAIPTTTDLMERFLKKEISEKILFEQTPILHVYEAVYLCAAFTLPQYRKQGLAKKLFQIALQSLPVKKNATLFAWVLSGEGSQLAVSVEKQTGEKILFRE